MRTPFKFLNIVNDNEGIDIFLNGEIIDNGAKGLYDFFEVDSTCPGSFCEALDKANGKPLTLHINSIGGDLIAGMAMASAIKNYKGKTTAIVDSICASAATLPMVSCKKVIMQVHSTIMIHRASLWTCGNKTDLEKDIATLESLDNSIANAYESKTKMSRNEILNLMDKETWLDSKKAKELGFIDEIFGKTEIPDEVIKNIINSNKRLVACYRNIKNRGLTEEEFLKVAREMVDILESPTNKAIVENVIAEVVSGTSGIAEAIAEIRSELRGSDADKDDPKIDEALQHLEDAISEAQETDNKKTNFGHSTQKAPKKDTAITDDPKLYCGKFKSIEELEKAYASLQTEFTRKSQKLAELENHPSGDFLISNQKTQAATSEPQDDSAKIQAEFEFAIAMAKAKSIIGGIKNA